MRILPLAVLALIILAGGLGLGIWVGRWGAGGKVEIQVQSSVEGLREVGELTVLRLRLQEIVTAKLNKENLSIPKQAAYIVSFDVDCWYDLKDRSCTFASIGDGRACIRLPALSSRARIADIKVYDKVAGQWWLWSYPITIDEENLMLAQARSQAEARAKALTDEHRSLCERSATVLLEQLAKGLGVQRVEVSFAP